MRPEKALTRLVNWNRFSRKGCFTYTPNPNRNRTVTIRAVSHIHRIRSETVPKTVTATELHHFVFGRPFTYEPNAWTKSKKMPV